MNKGLSFFKENVQFIYSLILIILIPAIIVVNTIFGLEKIKKNMDTELQRKATLANEVFAGAVADTLEKETFLQDKINKILTQSPEVKEINILKRKDDNFIVSASSNEANLGQISQSLQDTQATLAWKGGESVAILNTDETIKPAERFWSVVTPLKDNLDKIQGLVEMKVSLKDIDILTRKTLNQSLIILVVTVFIVLLLLINHLRFFEYAILFKRLKEVDKMKDDFISVASHELKTPMAAIKGYLAMIFEGLGGKVDPKAMDYLKKAFANTKRLDILVNELLDVSRLEQGRMKFDLKPMDISQVIREVVEELKIKADEKKLALVYEELPDRRPKIMADSQRISQIFNNLIGNAIKYTLKGKVEISHQIDKAKLKTIVKDTGVGMSPEERKRLFEKFYRIQNKKTMGVSGTGLGLWITREIIHRMNGEIYVDSMENVGSQFSIVFPINKNKD